ncbi:SH3 domain-containing protein [Pseudooceanicola sp. CBS1P-1]|uniref:SH3 domain-containing protein n=1 Tax=Pseudooceanicola albus TaxID=2692189 RepID=A0A6L7GAB4_9RHOB|nr:MULTISPECIES: SH3 domain-containing protein [Pseudooceanicola]MBT9382816.1 SH3 domain-containing protein [Pseudooceanicola endophyticus]MXN20260.1 SH3 domain-containing protein [Pseudooceanicola albus]
MFRFLFIATTSFLLFLTFFQMSGGFDFQPLSPRKADQEIARNSGARLAEIDPDLAPADQTQRQADRSAQASGGTVQLASAETESDAVDPAAADLSIATISKAALPAPAPTGAPKTPGSRASASSDQVDGVRQDEARAIAAAMAPQGTTPGADIREVSGNVVNMRSGPGTGYGVVDQLNEGTRVEVLDQKGGWLKLRATSGNSATGWMYSGLLTASN